MKRFISLDVLRGLTILGMILVNNPGRGGAMEMLCHKSWDGITLADFIFPLFIFIVGASMYFAFQKSNYELNGAVAWKIVKRSVLIFVVGYALNAMWFTTPISEIRIMAALQRIAIVYLLASFLVLWLKTPKKIIPLTVILLLGYWAFVHFTGSYMVSDSMIGKIDTMIIGEDRMYRMQGELFDPEGIVGTVSSLCNALIGYLFAMAITKRGWLITLLGGILMVGVGILWAEWFELNKAIWSSSFVLVTCGAGAMLWAVAYWLIDVKGKATWSGFLRVLGTNAILAYVISRVLDKILWSITLTDQNIDINYWLYTNFLEHSMPGWCASLVWSLLVVALTWIIVYPLYRRKIYVKL